MVKVLRTVERELLITVCDICGDEIPDDLFNTGRALMIKHCTNGDDGSSVYSLTQDAIDLCNDCFANYTDMLPIKSSLHLGDRVFEWNEKAFEQGIYYHEQPHRRSSTLEVLRGEDDALVDIPDHI